uniref:Uncharacterized protein n=2 Tax=viral metagenome TaxID=1070528 RepID=A0A6M3K8G9_9ZZZZ
MEDIMEDTMEVKKKAGRPRREIKETEKILKKILESEQVQEAVPAVFPDGTKIEVLGPVAPPTLTGAQFDPFEKFKKEPNKFHYRALNNRAHNLRKREAEGYELVQGAKPFGDLVLAKIPIENKKAREKKKSDRLSSMKRAVKAKFREEAAQHGVETFEE